MSDFPTLSANLKERLNKIQLSPPLTPQRFTPDVLSNPTEIERALFGSTDAAVEIDKRTLQFRFSSPIFIQSIRVYLNSSLLVKTLRLNFSGEADDRVIEVETGRLSDSAEEITIGCHVVGFEFVCGKHIKDSIKGVEAFGFDQNAYRLHIEETQNANPQLTKIKNEVAKQLSDLDEAFKQVQEGQERLKEINRSVEEKKAEKQALDQSLKDVNEAITQKNGELENQRTALTNALAQQTAAEEATSDAKNELTDLKTALQTTNRELNEMREKKSFYNETLVGHKKETNKNVLINAGLMVCMMVVLYELVHFVIKFYQESIHQFATITDHTQLGIVATFRTGAGVLFFFIFRYCFRVLSQIFSRTYQLITDTRNIEGKLVIARAVAETALKAQPDADPEERRNFSGALAFSVLKNHFLNMSHESIVSDLEVDEEEVEEVMPRIPQKYVLPVAMAAKKAIAQIAKTPESNQ